ncbi:MAG: peptide deformylase [Saprospiraceae bacterium]|nr:peptide deformylase [Saprospiraceae bacterium]
MILPIYAFGQKILKQVGKEIGQDFEDLDTLIANMWETMYNAKGIGLAAPQVGKSLRLFLVDTKQIEEEEQEHVGIKKVFINAEMIEESGEEMNYEEGCLSIPDIRGDVLRQPTIRIWYQDENFEEHEEDFTGINARVIQHEYDHIEGKLFTEKLQPLKKRLIKRKLDNIRKGKIAVDYRMRFAVRK